MLWFTADLHLGHASAIKFGRRPWADVDKMNDALISAINVRVAVNDELYILGDYSFRISREDAAALRGRIRCRRVHLVPGNHDKDWSQPEVAKTFIVEPPIATIKHEGHKLVLSHFPLAEWPAMVHGSWHVHGHIHSIGTAYNELNREQGLLRYDAGVDANGWEPVSFAQLKKWFAACDARELVTWREWAHFAAAAPVGDAHYAEGSGFENQEVSHGGA